MSDLPKTVTIVEEGPREGFQSEPPGIATSDKVSLIEALAKAGLSEINCCSFVDAKRLPQMADAEDIAAAIDRRPGTRYTGIWLNERGFNRAQQTSLHLEALIVGSASETFLVKNNNRTVAQSLEEQRRMFATYKAAGLSTGPAYVSCAFGCNFEGDVRVEAVERCVNDLIGVYNDFGEKPSCVYLCDTVGSGNPLLVQMVVGAVRERWPDFEFGLHLHDTRGLGLSNALAGLQLGVSRFDASCGGLGGCPFAGNKAAAGNIATEDLALMCSEMGIETGVDIDVLIGAAQLAERIVGHPLPGKTMKSGRIKHSVRH
jgi:hydroxymethylglutaryl-CoA lyase